MVQTMIMAKKFQQRPSKILDIEDGYLAYMIDEFSLFIEQSITDDKGNINWDKIKYDNKEQQGNSDMMELIKKQK